MNRFSFLCLLVVCVSVAPAQILVDSREYRLAAENPTLALHTNEESATFVLTDKRSGHQWTSFVPESEPSFSGANTLWQRKMQSLFTFTYTDLSSGRAALHSTSLMEQEHTIGTRAVAGGTVFDIRLDSLGISISIEVKLDDSKLLVRLPASSIAERGDNVLVAVSVLPFLGYATSDDDGYMLLPDGCGALYRYKPTSTRAIGDEKRLSWYVYGPEDVGFAVYYWGLQTAFLPVYGVKVGESAFAAIISEGDTDAYIRFAESGAAVNLTRVASEFTVRRAFELYLSEISVHGAYAENPVTMLRFDEARIGTDREVTYEFLHGADADYSGMAGAYRSHLKDRGTLVRRDEQATIPTALTLFGGIIEDRLLFDRYVAMTTFAEAIDILSGLEDLGVQRIVANLVGWTEDGYGRAPVIWPPERALGGERRLRGLAEYASSIGTDLYLSIDPVLAIQGNGRFNTRTDVVKEGNNLPVTTDLLDLFLLNPQVSLARAAGLVDELDGFGIRGINFEAIGSFLFHDYNTSAPSSRRSTFNTWAEMVDLSTSTFGSASLDGAHAEMAARADMLFQVPMESSGFIVLDDEVPFYQMVMHGSVPYAGNPANLFYDTREQYLRWIEYGCIPHYELTYRSSELLANTPYAHLFTSHYADWLETAAEHHTEFNRDFGEFFHLEMVDHEWLSEVLVRIAYSDGSVVLVNYGTQRANYGDLTIPGEDYAVIRGEVD